MLYLVQIKGSHSPCSSLPPPSHPPLLCPFSHPLPPYCLFVQRCSHLAFLMSEPPCVSLLSHPITTYTAVVLLSSLFLLSSCRHSSCCPSVISLLVVLLPSLFLLSSPHRSLVAGVHWIIFIVARSVFMAMGQN